MTYIKKTSKWIVWHFSSKLDVPSNVLQKKRVARILFFKIRPSQEILKIRDGTTLEKKRVARILFFKIWPSQKILKIRDGTPLEAEEILTYRKSPQNGSVWYFSSKLDIPSNVLQKKRVAHILVFKIRPSQDILKIRDGTPLEKKRVARILFFKIWPSQKILKIRDGTPLEAEEILTYRKSPQNGSVWYFSSKLDIPSNVLQKKRVAHILVFKIRPSQDILKIRDGTPLEAEEILTYRKKPSKWIDVPSKVLQKKGVARILVFKIRPSQEILKIRDGTPLEVEEILTYIKKTSKWIVWHFSSKLDVPSNVLQKKRVARILFFKIRPSQEILKIRDGTTLEKRNKRKKRVARILFFKIWPSQKILKIRDGTPLEAEEILTYRKSPQNGSVWYFSSKLDIPSNVLQKKRVAHILVFKIRPSQDILKIRDGTPLEAEEILTYRKKPSKWIVKKRVARILFFKIWPSQKILKIRDGTPLEAEEILTYRKSPQNGSVWYFSSKLDIPSNVLQKKRVAHILVFKIRPSQDILKIRDGTPLEAEEILTYRKKPSKWIVKKRVARILFFKIWPSQKILKIRDGTPLEAEEILTYRKSPQNGSVWYFSSKLDIPSNVLQKKRVAHILVFKIRPSQDILKIRDGTPLEKRVVRILVFKIRSTQEIHKIRDGTPLELDVPSNVLQKKRVARILFFKIWPSQKILKIRDGTPLEAEEILTYRKSPQNGSVWYFSSKLDIPSNVLQKKRVAHILVFKIRPSQDILKIRDGTPLELDVPSKVLQKKGVARILVFKIRPSQEILKIRDGTPLEVEEILTYIKKTSKWIVWHFSSKLDVPSNVLQKKRVARILFFKIRPSQEILKIRDGTTLEKKRNVPSKVLQKKGVARILVFKIRPSQEILKIRDGTPLEVEEILTYIKKTSKWIVWHFSSKLDVPSNVLQKKRVARILFFKIRPSQEILKIRDGTTLEAGEILTYRKKPSKWIEILKIRDDVPSNVLQKKRVARILFFKIWPSQKILKIRDGTPLEAEEILTYRKSPQNGSVWYFSSKLDIPSNVLQKKRVAHILVFKIRPSQDILKIRDGTPLEKIHKIRDGTPLEMPSQDILKIRDEILKIRDDVPSNVLQKKRVARILFFKIWPSQKILKIRDGTPLEAEEILTYRKSPQNGSVWYFSSKLDIPSNVLQKKRVAHILVFKIRPSQDILKIRDGTPLEAEEILTYRKKPSKWIESTQEIHKIRDGTPLEIPSQEILKIRDDVPSNVLQKKRVARILFFKIWPSQKILKIRDGTPLEAEEILTYRKSPQNGSVWYFSSKLDIPSNVLQKKRVAHILVFKIRPSQDILKIRDGTPLEAEEILTYRKKPSKWIESTQEIHKIRDGTPLEKKRVVRILVFKIRSSQEIHKIRDGTPLEVEEILTYIKKPRNGSFGTFLASYMSLVMYYRRKEWHGFWFSKLDHLKKFSKF
ncbi:hypothetical protein OROHE_007087 [Orobanche hederae]